jgi:hypothetical protein
MSWIFIYQNTALFIATVDKTPNVIWLFLFARLSWLDACSLDMRSIACAAILVVTGSVKLEPFIRIAKRFNIILLFFKF